MKKKRCPIQPPEGISEVLLHACCAPCSSAIVEWMLANDIRPTIFYFNPNIYPIEEYTIRKEESKRHADSLGIQWIDGDYNHQDWLRQISRLWQETYKQGLTDWHQGRQSLVSGGGLIKQGPTDCRQGRQSCGMEQEPERGRRCELCFRLRLTATAKKARELGLTYFTTTLASSRWKSIDQITHAGLTAQADVPGTIFWAQNWRKGGLSDRRNQLLKEYNFYNQQYCGCEYSMRR